MIAEKKIILCGWKNIAERVLFPDVVDRCCEREATSVSCSPVIETPTCDEHKCDCSRALVQGEAGQVRRRSYAEDLKGSVKRGEIGVAIFCRKHPDAPTIVEFVMESSEVVVHCDCCMKASMRMRAKPMPVAIIPVRFRRN